MFVDGSGLELKGSRFLTAFPTESSAKKEEHHCSYSEKKYRPVPARYPHLRTRSELCLEFFISEGSPCGETYTQEATFSSRSFLHTIFKGGHLGLQNPCQLRLQAKTPPAQAGKQSSRSTCRACTQKMPTCAAQQRAHYFSGSPSGRNMMCFRCSMDSPVCVSSATHETRFEEKPDIS